MANTFKPKSFAPDYFEPNKFEPQKLEPQWFKPLVLITCDKATREWFKKHPGAQTTVAQCEKCALWYKPSLGHKCEVKK